MNLAFLPLLEERISLQEGGSGALPMSDHGAPDCIVQAFSGDSGRGYGSFDRKTEKSSNVNSFQKNLPIAHWVSSLVLRLLQSISGLADFNLGFCSPW